METRLQCRAVRGGGGGGAGRLTAVVHGSLERLRQLSVGHLLRTAVGAALRAVRHAGALGQLGLVQEASLGARGAY